MPFQVFDYRRDLRNVVVTPEIRARFMRLEPGATASRHSHDLGHEVFLVLEGEAEFEIAGHCEVVGPGQMCFAQADELHQVRVLGDRSMTLYLSVTPHVEPTHTRWNSDGTRQPPRYSGFARRESGDQAPDAPFSEVVDRYAAAAGALADAATTLADHSAATAEALTAAVADERADRARATVDASWERLYRLRKALTELELAWNELSPRATEPA
jgi:quercetin dioxygenase-like cupin family protein